MNGKEARTWIVAAIIVVVTVSAYIYYIFHKHYNWYVDSSTTPSEEPFSTTVLKKVLSRSFEKGFALTTDLDSLEKIQHEDEQFNVINVSGIHGTEYPDELKRMAELAERGAQVVHTAYQHSFYSNDFFGFQRYKGGNTPYWDEEKFTQNHEREKLLFEPHYTSDQQLTATAEVEVYAAFLPTSITGNRRFCIEQEGKPQPKLYLQPSDFYYKQMKEGYNTYLLQYSIFQVTKVKNVEVMLASASGNVLAVRYNYASGGSLLYLAPAVVFSNYAVVDPNLRELLTHIVAPLANEKVFYVERIIKKDSHPETRSAQRGPLYIFLERPPLRLFLWILLALGLFSLINMRRRQRALEAPRHLENSSLDFVKQVATLFHRRTDYRGLLHHEVRLLLDHLRDEFQFEMVGTSSQFHDFLPLLAERLHLNDATIKHYRTLFDEIQSVLDADDTSGAVVTQQTFVEQSRHIHKLIESLNSQKWK